VLQLQPREWVDNSQRENKTNTSGDLQWLFQTRTIKNMVEQGSTADLAAVQDTQY
jgi:hypothetical protein